MEHDLFIDGTVNEYTWSIKTGDSIVEQIREHPDAYVSGGKLDVKNDSESKFIAIHVGIYWGLGVYIIKDFDVVNFLNQTEALIRVLFVRLLLMKTCCSSIVLPISSDVVVVVVVVKFDVVIETSWKIGFC